MKDWLVKLAEQTKSEDEVLQEALEALPPSMLQELSYEFDPSSRPSALDAMQDKIASAIQMGHELAHEHGDELEKQAFLPLLAPLAGMAGRALAGTAVKQGLKSMAGSVVKNVAKDAVVNGATKAISGAVRPPQQTMSGGMGGGGFSYGKVAGVGALGGLAQRAAGYAVRNPGMGAALAGAGVGALMAPRDPQTGEKQYLRGAVMGGGLAAGANALSKGAIGNKMRSAVMNRESPILGQKARQYMMDSAKATKGSYKTPPPTGPGHVGGEAAMKNAPRARNPNVSPAVGAEPPAPAGEPAHYISPAFAAHHEGAREAVEMGQLNRQLSTMNQAEPGTFSALARPAAEMPNGLPAPQAAAINPNMSPIQAGAVGAHAPGYAMSLVPGMGKKASRAQLILRAASMDKVANQKALTYDPATKTFVRPTDKLASLRKRAMFSMKTPTTGGAIGGAVRGMMGAGAKATPPPIPAAAKRSPIMAGAAGMGASSAAGGNASWANSPYRAPAKQAPGLAGVQSQLNSAQSIGGGGPAMPGGASTIRAMPGSGW